MEQPHLCGSSGRWPAVCAQSSSKCTPALVQSAPIAAASCTVPNTFDICVITTRRVLFSIARATACGAIRPSASGGTSVSVITPVRESSDRGRSTELCSMSVETTWSPLRITPWMAMLSASVAFSANATRDASLSPSMRAISSLQPSTIRPARSESA